MTFSPRLTAFELADARAEAREELDDLVRLHAPELGLPAPPAEPDGPCDGCAISSRCAGAKVACSQYEIYVKVGGSRRRWAAAPKQPSRVIFDRLFTEPFKDRGERSGMSTDERRAAAKGLSDRGHSRSVIAELLGVVNSTVRLDLLGPSANANPKKFSKTRKESTWLIERRAAVRELAAQGRTRREIAAALGVDKQKVSRDLRLAGATAASPAMQGRVRATDGRYRRTAAGELRLPVVKELALEGRGAREIAAIVGVHRRTVCEDFKLLGGWRNIREHARAASFPPGEEGEQDALNLGDAVPVRGAS